MQMQLPISVHFLLENKEILNGRFTIFEWDWGLLPKKIFIINEMKRNVVFGSTKLRQVKLPIWFHFRYITTSTWAINWQLQVATSKYCTWGCFDYLDTGRYWHIIDYTLNQNFVILYILKQHKLSGFPVQQISLWSVGQCLYSIWQVIHSC